MTIYIVMIAIGQDGHDHGVQGVFASRILAEQFVKDELMKDELQTLTIEEHSLQE